MDTPEEKLGAQFANIRRELDGIAKDVNEINRESRRNFRVLMGALVVVGLGIIGLIIYGLVWL